MNNGKQRQRYRRKWQAIGLGVVGLSLLTFAQGAAYVRSAFSSGTAVFWPNAATTVNLQFGCPQQSLIHWGPCWDDAAIHALSRWNEEAARFQFTWQRATAAVDACNHTDSINTAAFADSICGTGFGDALAVTISSGFLNGTLVDTDVLLDSARSWSTYSGPLQRNEADAVTTYDFHRVVLHEFGHVLGLDHPDQSGQVVKSLMNSRVSNLDDIQADDIAGVNAIYPNAAVSGTLLEDPQSGATMSGLTLIRGWACSAGRIDLVIDGVSFQAAYPTVRGDTAAACNNEGNNGFSLLFNWNLAGDGAHTVVALKDGVEFGRATVNVVTLGQQYLTGASGQYILPDFPTTGRNVIVEWRESLQNFVVIGTE